MASLHTSWAFGLFSIGLAGCSSLIGLDDFVDAKPGSAGGGAATTGSGGSGGTSAGGGGSGGTSAGGGGAGGTSAGGGGAGGTSAGGGGAGGTSAGGGGAGGTSAGGGGAGGTSAGGGGAGGTSAGGGGAGGTSAGGGGAGGTGGASTTSTGSGGAGGTGGTGGASTTSTGSGGAGGASTTSTLCGKRGEPCCPNDACADGTLTCSNGTCQCALECNGSCVDPTSADFCGSCQNKCESATEYCSDSLCLCQNGEHCGGACTDTQSDSSNCGSCGNVCTGGTTCQNGNCTCTNAWETSCGSTCVNLQKDPDHCGSCGHGCIKGECAQGKCEPVVVATKLDSTPGVLVTDGERVYWTTEKGIFTVFTKGGTPTPFATEGAPPADLAVDEANLYWTLPIGLQVRRMASDGSGPVDTVAQETVGSEPSRIGLDDTNVYWRAPNGIRAAKKTGVNQTPTAVYPTANMSNGPMVMLDDVVYWTNNGELWRAVPKSGGWNSGQLKTGLGTVFTMAITSDSVFWSQWNQSLLVRAALDGTNPSNVGVAQSKAMVSRGGDVYWSHSNNSIKMYSTNDQIARDVIQLASTPIGLAIDDKAIYWATSDSIMKLAR